MSSQLKICDVSLRDGSHRVRHQFTVEQVVSIAKRAGCAGVAMVEVSHGDGLGRVVTPVWVGHAPTN